MSKKHDTHGEDTRRAEAPFEGADDELYGVESEGSDVRSEEDHKSKKDRDDRDSKDDKDKKGDNAKKDDNDAKNDDHDDHDDKSDDDGDFDNAVPTEILLDTSAIAENVASGVVGNLTVSDLTVGDTHSFLVSDPRFEVVNDQLKLKAGQSLDFETENTVSLNITATDALGGTVTRSFTLSVGDVNEAPTAVALNNSIVAENAVGAVVGALSVSDVDAGDAHTFTTSDARFEVVNGDLKLKAGESLDFETEPTVNVDVTATDTGGQSVVQSFAVSVTGVNEAPTAVALNNSIVAENAVGAVVGALSVTDVDAGDTHTFTTSDARFEVINGDLKLKAGESLDFETEATVNIDVTATDTGGQSVVQSFVVSVTDVYEAPAGGINSADGIEMLWRNTTDGFTSAYVNGDAANQVSMGFTSDEFLGVADFNGDGLGDVLWRNTASGGTYAALNGNQNDSLWMYDRGADTYLGSGDLNGDGNADALWQDASGGTFALLSGDANTSLWMDNHATHTLLDINDYNGDGSDDLLWQAQDGGTWFASGGDNANTLWLGDRSGDALLAVADFNGDGQSDTLWQNTTNGATFAFLSGDSSTSLWMDFRSGQELLGIADFNGDGQDDALWRDTTTGATSAELSGNTNTSQWMYYHNGDDYLGAGDINGDGNADAVWRDASGGTYAMLSGNAANTFWMDNNATNTLLGINDYNGDGKEDLLWQDQASGGTWYASAGDNANTVWLGDRSNYELLAYQNDDLGLIV